MDSVHRPDVYVRVLLGHRQHRHLLDLFLFGRWIRIHIQPQNQRNALALQCRHCATHSCRHVPRAVLFSVCWSIFGPEGMSRRNYLLFLLLISPCII